MAEESLDEILSSPTPAATPEAAPKAETTTEQPATGKTEGPARDEHGKFAPKATPAATSEQPATAEQPESGTVPQQALHEARALAKEQRERADRFEAAFLASKTPPAAPATPVEPPKPVDFWDNPDKWGESKLSPLQEEISQTRSFYSHRDAVREYGAEYVKTATEALGKAVDAGRLDDVKLTEYLKRSMDPVGEIIKWHKEETNKQRIGDDPDAFVNSELDKMLADPAKKAELLARLNGTPLPSADQGQTPTNITRLPPSLSRLPGGNAEPVSGNESLESIIRTGRRR